mgnify:CR=1
MFERGGWPRAFGEVMKIYGAIGEIKDKIRLVLFSALFSPIMNIVTCLKEFTLCF